MKINELLDSTEKNRKNLSTFVKSFEDPTNSGNKNKRTIVRKFHKWVNDFLLANSGTKRNLPPMNKDERLHVTGIKGD